MLGDAFASDVRRGLTASPKRLDPRYFYDALGSALFAAICELPEYYVTRAEREILDRAAAEIARGFDSPSRLVELGSGNATKTRSLIAAILAAQPALLYQPVDVDASMLEISAREIHIQFPQVTAGPLCADYHDIVRLGTTPGRTAVLFLGSSIGNLDHAAATALLGEVRRILREGDSLFVGFDLVKDKDTLEAAYDDALGVTAAFNLNLLARINRELGGSFVLDRFSHRSFFNQRESRIEMHLVSNVEQSVRIEALGMEVRFAAGETIHTENSYKYTSSAIEELSAAAGFRVEQTWTDSRRWFTDVLLRPA